MSSPLFPLVLMTCLDDERGRTFARQPALPFLHTTEVFLYPVVGIIMLLLLSIVLLPFGIRVNATLTMAKLYFLE